MVDINLLKDTKDEDANQRKKPPVRPQFDLSAPGRERLEEREVKPPSKFSVWVRGLFGAKPPKRDAPFTPERAPHPKSTPIGKIVPPEVTTAPPDIFAPLDQRRPAPPAKASPPPPQRNGNGKKSAPAAPAKPTPAPGSFLVNLLPEELSISPVEVRQRFMTIGLVAVFTVVGIVAVYFLLVFYQLNFVNKTASVQEEITTVQADIQKLRPTQVKALEFTQRVDLLKSTLDRHIYWTNFFDKLEKYIIQNVAVSSLFKGSVGTSFTIDGVAPTVEDVAHQLAVLQQAAPDFVTEATLDSLARTQAQTLGGANVSADSYSFSISVTLVDGLFIQSNQPPAESAETPSAAPAP